MGHELPYSFKDVIVTPKTPQEILDKMAKLHDKAPPFSAGNFGSAHRIKDYVIKVASISPEARQQIQFERTLLQQLNHPNIVRVLTDDEQKIYSEMNLSISFMMPNYTQGDLYNALFENNEPTSTDLNLAKVAQDISAALSYIHGQNIIHRDIKAENILLDSHHHAVLTDFGLALKLNLKKPQPIELVGTPAMFAPEILHAYLNSTKTTPASPTQDIYSFGLLLLQMMHHSHPYNTLPSCFDGRTPIDLKAAFNLKKTNGFLIFYDPHNPKRENHPLMRHVVNLICQYEPERRPTANELQAFFNTHIHEPDLFVLKEEHNLLSTIYNSNSEEGIRAINETHTKYLAALTPLIPKADIQAYLVPKSVELIITVKLALILIQHEKLKRNKSETAEPIYNEMLDTLRVCLAMIGKSKHHRELNELKLKIKQCEEHILTSLNPYQLQFNPSKTSTLSAPIPTPPRDGDQQQVKNHSFR